MTLFVSFADDSSVSYDSIVRDTIILSQDMNYIFHEFFCMKYLQERERERDGRLVVVFELSQTSSNSFASRYFTLHLRDVFIFSPIPCPTTRANNHASLASRSVLSSSSVSLFSRNGIKRK